ncbi:MAG TPA: VOC family protein [Thermoanaerobaculia bacterium]|jgi:predicted enzyme related to lactoylglutathione lyase|nr:VOC family protein [Thermoanaerobaculia bacterium]
MATRKATSKKVTTKGAKDAKAAKSANVAKGAKGAKVAKRAKGRVAPDVPSLFRLNVEVGDLDQAVAFYGKLFGLEGRKQAGSRCYFTCGPVTLQVVDVSSAGKPHPAAKALYFTVEDLDAIWARAKALGCLSREDVHGVSGGAISVRPWGERSFYAEDKWQNPLCFVEAGTIYPG